MSVVRSRIAAPKSLELDETPFWVRGMMRSSMVRRSAQMSVSVVDEDVFVAVDMAGLCNDICSTMTT